MRPAPYVYRCEWQMIANAILAQAIIGPLSNDGD